METEPLRIAFATCEYVTEKYFYGGLAQYTHRAAKALAGLGHDVHVVTLSEIDDAEFEHEGVRVHRVTGSRVAARFNAWTGHRMGLTARYLDLSFKVHRELRRLHAQKPFRLFQFPNYSVCGLVSTLRLGVPHVLRASSYQPELNEAVGVRRSPDARTVELLEALQFRLSRHVHAPSDTLRRTLRERAGVRGVRVIRSPFYPEIDEWDDSVYERDLRGKKYLLFFGRFQLHKGFHTPADALPRFLERFPGAHAALVGRDSPTALAPSMADYVRERCGRFAERLIMPGELRHGRLYPVIEGARLVVLPSLLDNFPNACLEAMGLGKVVVGTAGTSLDELITEGETGFLVPPNDSGALSDALARAWTHPDLTRMGEAARLKMSEFSPERTIPVLLDYYREVLRGADGSTNVRAAQASPVKKAL
ncbi:MAG: glycosyltransferase family 4 protein [Pyrinomonadaceae bacterium]